LKTTQVNALQSIDLDGASARLIASKPKTSAGEETIVVVARTASDRMELLSEYRTEVWYAASIGTLLATLLSFFLVRGGLRPLRLMAAQT
ncbi:hypothetical protein ABTK00_20290, partial [Acinetobacter baumannii]